MEAQKGIQASQESLGGPYLQIAVLCEKVLLEGPVMSLIRIVDRFTVSGPTQEISPAVLRFFIVILFKSGFIRGKHALKIKPRSPSGKDLPSVEYPLLFEGDADRGTALASEINFEVNEEGVYWFEVYLEDASITQMPLRVIYQRIAVATPASN